MESLRDVVSKLCIDSGFDDETAWFVIDTYLRQSKDLLENAYTQLNDGSDESYKVMEGLMHKLKGSSGNVRAFGLMNLALSAEASAKERDYEALRVHIDHIAEILEKYVNERS